MKCVITVPGRTGGGHGHPTKNRTGPLEEFLVDNQVFYKHVRRHLEQCPICDPVAVLQVYLERRRTEPKFKGVAADTFVKNAVAYIKICQKRNIPAPTGLLMEIFGRGLDPEYLVRYESLLGTVRIAQALFIMREVLVQSQYMGPGTRLTTLANKGLAGKLAPVIDYIYDTGGPLPPEDELEDLAKVAEVMLS